MDAPGAAGPARHRHAAGFTPAARPRSGRRPAAAWASRPKRASAVSATSTSPRNFSLALTRPRIPTTVALWASASLPVALPTVACVALDVENVVGDLEGFPDAGAEAVER